ncbi:sugar porter family MFS transporter [Actinotalea sp. M2MS4P-6]|uniref:sugar porter family MFS transporter n=1 Tax=Actinotalea sp. M2MS4P-6 TaxID=2983762 RepID=UPI0021E4BE2B|nr:sugar porter family MFS transporter [Actinotalea sp. M2MS4P-6]MCV2392948.1 sugar porter family MFS transporter [Actinotalea sp. M2MS4P-6]
MNGGRTAKVVGLAATAALGGLLFGYDSSVINGAVSAIGEEFSLGSAALGFTVASALLGAAAGAWTTGSIAERFGRPRTMVMAATLFTASAVLTGLSQSIGFLIVWRVVGGFAVGMASVIAPMYIAEIAPADIRGRLGSLQQLAIVSGIFASQLVNLGLVNLAGGAAGNDLWGLSAWRWMLVVEAVPAIAYGLLALRLPESPRHLVAEGRDAEARDVLALFSDDPGAELTRIEESLAGDAKPRFADLRGPVLGLAAIVWVGIVLSMLQQLTGINVVFYYSTALWEAVGVDTSQALLISVVTAAVNIGGTVLAIAIIDRVGRRVLLLAGSAGMTVALAVTAWAFSTATVDASGAAALDATHGLVAFFSANTFVFFFAFSWGPVVWVLLGEMFPNRLRAAALAVAAAVQWLANFAVTQTFPWLAENLGLAVSYSLFAAFSAVSLWFVLRYVAETKGRALEDMGSGVAA